MRWGKNKKTPAPEKLVRGESITIPTVPPCLQLLRKNEAAAALVPDNAGKTSQNTIKIPLCSSGAGQLQSPNIHATVSSQGGCSLKRMGKKYGASLFPSSLFIGTGKYRPYLLWNISYTRKNGLSTIFLRVNLPEK